MLLVVVDWCASQLARLMTCSKNAASSVLRQLLFLLSSFFTLENKLIGYADHSTLLSVVPSSCIRVTISVSLNLDLIKVSEQCDF